MPLSSHEYQLTIRAWIRVIAPTLIVVACSAVILKTGSRLKLWPTPHVAADPTTTVLLHQARAAQSRQPAKLVLVGDSTCMVDVDAPALSRQLPGQPVVMNLALLIWLGFRTYGEALADFVEANPGQVDQVVLLVTPRKLSLDGDPNQEQLWQQLRAQARKQAGSPPAFGRSSDWIGSQELRRNLLSHWLATPLRGRGPGTEYYGFSSEVDVYMTAHRGSLLEFGTVSRPRHYQPAKLAPAPGLAAESRAFRGKVPARANLVIGLTPVAESYSSPAERRQRTELLSLWSSCIRADRVLTNLPVTLPDLFFANEGHLNEAGQKRFTELLARVLAPMLDSGQPGKSPDRRPADTGP